MRSGEWRLVLAKLAAVIVAVEFAVMSFVQWLDLSNRFVGAAAHAALLVVLCMPFVYWFLVLPRRRGEKAIQDCLDRLSVAIKGANDGLWDWDIVTGEVYLSVHLSQMLGRDENETHVSYEEWETRVHPDDRDRVLAALRNHLESGLPYDVDYRLHPQSGVYRWLNDRGQAVRDAEGNAVRMVVATRDITSLRVQARVLESMAEGVFMCEEDGTIIFTNPAFDAMFGYDRGELIARNVRVLNDLPAEENERRLSEIAASLKAEGSWEGELNNVKKDGTPFVTRARISSLEKNGKSPWVSVQQDVTKQRQAQEQVQKSLEEKEILLREVHHRVKNNLQIISSLLRIRSRYIKDQDAAQAINETQNRILIMSLVHDKLHRTTRLGSIDFKGYIARLVDELFRLSETVQSRIAITLDLEDATLDIDRTIYCGLLLNELITNALRHAFPGERTGEIKISLHASDEGGIVLTVADNGVGIPGDIDWRNSNSPGLQLVADLAEKQLEGRVELDTRQGTKFTIQFNRGP